MANKTIKRSKRAVRRRRRVRGKIFGTVECPRLTVAKTLNNIYAQVIDDENRITLVSCATNAKDVKGEFKEGLTKTEKAKIVGGILAKISKEKGIEKVVFDRNRFRFHGRVKAVADGAREGGLKF